MGIIKKGSCHCGAVRFELEVKGDIAGGRRCNCSLCRRKQAVMYLVAKESLKVVEGTDNLALYQWNTEVAKHYFCKTCGIYTHHQRRTDPTQYRVNIACIEGVDPYALEVEVIDGASLSVNEA